MCIQNEILYLILLVKENLFTTINIKGTFLMTWHVCVWYFVKRDCIMIVIFDSSFNLNHFVESRFLFCCCYCSCCCWNDDDVRQSNTVRSFLPSFRSTSTLFVFLAQVGHIVDKLRGSCIGGLFRFLHRCINSRHRIWTSFQKIF